MKPRPKDLLDTLTTGEDKVSKVNEIKKFFRREGLKVRTQRRKLASGEKLYFYVEASIPEQWSGEAFRNFVRIHIKKHFPNSHMTSAGTDNITIAEY